MAVVDADADFGLSSWGVQSLTSSTSVSWSLQRYRVGSERGTTADVLERTLRSYGGREHFAHRNEVILRAGEMPRGLHLILDGAVQVLALGEFSENQSTWLEVDRLGPGDLVAMLPCLEKRPSYFSFKVHSRSLSSLMLPCAATQKAANFLTEKQRWYQEKKREETWEGIAIQRFEERACAKEAADVRLKEQTDFSGLGTRSEYLIPPECLMACHPNLPVKVKRQRNPPSPPAMKGMPEVQRFGKRQEKPNPEAEKPEKQEEEPKLSRLLSLERRPLTSLVFGNPGDVFHPKKYTRGYVWHKSDAYRFCQHVPVFQPELTDEDRRQGEIAAAQEAAEVAERELRLCMGRMMQVLTQVKRVIKSGSGKYRGNRIQDTDDLLNAMSPDEMQKLDRSDVAEAINGLGVASDFSLIEELVLQLDSENSGQIDREELADAVNLPKSCVKQMYKKLRNCTVAVDKADSLFSSDGEDTHIEDLDFLEDDIMPEKRVLSPRRMSLDTLPQEPPSAAAYKAMPSRPLSAPVRGKVVEPAAPKPIGKFHAIQRRLRRNQLRKGPRTRSREPNRDEVSPSFLGSRILVETETAQVEEVQEKSSRWPLSQSTGACDPITPKR